MKKLVLIVSSCFLFAGAAARAEDPAPPAKMVDVDKRIVLLVDEMHAIRNFPVVLADRLGYLNDGNMAVTVMNVRYDIWHGDLLMDGRVDAIMAYYHQNVVNQSQGRDTKAIVSLGVTPGMKVLVSNQAKDKYKTIADLKGSRFISGGAGSSKTTVANALILAGGNKLTDYSRLGTDGPEVNVESLKSGKADFVVAPTPDGSYYENKGVATVFADLTTPEGTKKAFGTVFPSSTIFMATERIRQHPEFAQFLANAFVRTLKYINTHTAEEIAAQIPDEIITKGKKATDKERADYLKVLKEQIPMFRNDGRMSAEGAEKELRVLAEFNPKYKPVKVETTYTNEFVDQAIEKIR